MSILSDRVLKITIDYIGPSSQAFLERQTKHHLNGVDFAKLDKSHLPELSRWVGISASLLVDKKRALELADKISKLN